ncbi:lipocalin family protein [Inquilinus sp. KBS0705]|nr:lipocalin family protein [Inquilinus sp. KBS0705]
MKPKFLIIPFLALAACKAPADQKTADTLAAAPIQGTWKLVSAVAVTKGDTVVTYPEKGQEDEMIKVINADHFAFFKHDLKKPGSKAIFDSGAGTYTFENGNYTENLQYCNYREWENHSFNFKASFKGDTLIQKGIEKIDSLKVDREIVETYVKIK